MHPAGTARERTAEAYLQPAVAARLKDDEARGLVSGLDQRVAADGAGREPELELARGFREDREHDAAGPVVAVFLTRRPHMAYAEREVRIRTVERLVGRLF